MEMRLLAELDSPYIIRYLGGSLTDNILVTEFMQNGDLRYAIMTQNPMVRWDNRGAAILLDIAKGLAFLHGQRFIHRDLKSPNILLSSDFRAKLADVGIARALAPGKNQIDTLSVKFSLRWASPENFTKEDYTTLTDRSDIYAFGVIMWEITTQSFPWDHIRWEYEICNQVKAGNHNPIPESCPPRVAALMKSCWSLDPEQRPSASQVVTELEDILLNSPPLEPVENLVLRFTGTSRDGDPKLGPDGNLILKEGTLSLRSVWLQMWHIRYFTLTQRNIIYWTYQNNQKAREIRISLFKLRKTKFYRNTANSHGCMFEFVTFSRTYTLVASSVTEAADWIAAIELAKGNTTSTRDTVMAAGEDHPNPEPILGTLLQPQQQQTPARSAKFRPSKKQSRPKASTLRPGKSSASAAYDDASLLPSSPPVVASSRLPASKEKVPAKTLRSGKAAAGNNNQHRQKLESSSFASSSSPSSPPFSYKFPFFPSFSYKIRGGNNNGSSKVPGTPVNEAVPGFNHGDARSPAVLTDTDPITDNSDRTSFTSNSSSQAPLSSSSARTGESGGSSWASGSVKFLVTTNNSRSESPVSHRIGTLSVSSDDTHVTSTTIGASKMQGQGQQQLLPASFLLSRSAPLGQSAHLLSRRPQLLSQPEPVNMMQVIEIEVAADSERQTSIESNEEQVTEIGIPASVIGSLNGTADQSSMMERTTTGTMKHRNGDILTVCYYYADEYDNQPPPRVLNLSGVDDYQELFEAVFDGFLHQLDGRGFSLWSKLVGSVEEYEILEAEFEDWRQCIANVDRINVKAMSTPRHIIGDNDHSEQIFRRSLRMSVPLNFAKDWHKVLENGLHSVLSQEELNPKRTSATNGLVQPSSESGN